MSEENRYAKRANEIKVVFRKRLFRVLRVLLILMIVMMLIGGVRYYYLNFTKNELFSQTTSQGYEIVIYEKGHPTLFLSNHHKIVIELDGEEILACTLLTDYEHSKEPLYPKQEIVCTKDTEQEYAVQFRKNSDYLSVRFSSDFSKVIDIRAYEIKIRDDLEVIRSTELDFVLFG